eukprot:scaffold34262_cov15-Tisochrysis_lutea.AAC.1
MFIAFCLNKESLEVHPFPRLAFIVSTLRIQEMNLKDFEFHVGFVKGVLDAVHSSIQLSNKGCLCGGGVGQKGDKGCVFFALPRWCMHAH